MSYLEITFFACSIIAGPTGSLCEQKHLVFAEDPASISAFQCAFTGQVELAKWSVLNPNWRISEGDYKCRPAGLFAKV